MRETTKAFVLVGPKGAGKSYVGRLAERSLGISFIDVEAIALSLPGGSTAGDLYALVQTEVERRLQGTDEVLLEVTGAAPESVSLFEHLRRAYVLRLIQISAPLSTCIERISLRDATTHLPTTPEMVQRVYAVSIAADLPYDLRLENHATEDADILSAIQSLRL